MSDATAEVVILGPGQGAQQVGMGRGWRDRSPAAAEVFATADRVLAGAPAFGGTSLSALCFEGPAERLNRTDVSQPALYACGVASWRALVEPRGAMRIRAAAGLSLGEYTVLHLAGAFSFEDGLRLVATRGRLMQEAAERSRGGMVALIGADEAQAEQVCAGARGGGVLVCANFNAPGQIVLSGDLDACGRAVELAGSMGLRATALQVAGAFHSPLMQPAADGLAEALAKVEVRPLRAETWSNVTALAHLPNDPDLLRRRLVEQLVRPVRWSQSMVDLIARVRSGGTSASFLELAPGTVLRGLMRRIDRSCEVNSHDQPPQPAATPAS